MIAVAQSMTPEQHRRLTLMGASSVVGGDIRAALAEIERLRKILAHVPSAVAIKAKEDAGYGVEVKPL